MHERRRANVLGIAGRVCMHRSIAPEEIDISRDEANLSESTLLTVDPVPQPGLGDLVVEQNLVGQISNIRRPHRAPLLQHDKIAGLTLERNDDGHESSQTI